jgi:hypothetical protein
VLPAQGGLQPSHRLLITKLHLHREDNTRAFRAPRVVLSQFPRALLYKDVSGKLRIILALLYKMQYHVQSAFGSVIICIKPSFTYKLVE